LPSQRDLPVADTLFVRLSASFFEANPTFLFLNSARAAHTVLIRSSNRSLFRQLRFVQARNLPELLNSTRDGFSSPLAATLPFAFGTRERTRETGEFCLRYLPFGLLKRSRANQPNPTFARSPGIILETFNPNLVCPSSRSFLASGPLHSLRLASPAALPTSTPLRDFYIRIKAFDRFKTRKLVSPDVRLSLTPRCFLLRFRCGSVLETRSA
jgi:hypothetical protein